MNDEERYRLHFGPYSPPKVDLGDKLIDAVLGSVTVQCFSDGKIPWPCMTIGKRKSLVLCDDLATAVKWEAATAVCHWWGVSMSPLRRWRKALRVRPRNEGTRRLRAAAMAKQVSKRWWESGVRVVSNPLFRTRQFRRLRRRGQVPGRKWTAAEDALLGTMFDRQVADRLGCSEGTVNQRRWKLGIAAFRKIPLRPDMLAVSRNKVLARRMALRLRQREVEERSGVSCKNVERGVLRNLAPAAVARLAAALECKPKDILLRRPPARPMIDDSLLGTKPDTVLARKWKLPKVTVRRRRNELGIPTFLSKRHPPIPEDRLLGKMSDRRLAALWGMPASWVRACRMKRGIPKFWQSSRLTVSAKKLRACRKRARLLQKQIAASMGMAVSSWRDLENRGTHTMHREAAERAAAVMQCRVADFVVPVATAD